MIEFGKTLREAREAKGLSISQVAGMTRIMHSIVEGLEKENFSGIPAPIYGRGFVKLYCEAVGLDPKPMVAEFMEIYNGNRDVAIKERPRTPAPEEEPVAEPAPAPMPEQEQEQEPEPEPEPNLEPEPILAPEPPPAELDLFSMSEAPKTAEPKPAYYSEPMAEPEPAAPLEKSAQSLSRYATPVRQRPEYRVPPMIGRWAALALGAAIVLVLVFLGLRALYRATSPAPSTIDDATNQTAAAVIEAERHEAAAPRREVKPRKDRTPQEIPSLYID